MNIINKLSLMICLSVFILNDTIGQTDKIKITQKSDYVKQLLSPKDTIIEGYRFKFGYYRYNEDIFGFQNPGFLEITKNNKRIFIDSIKGYDDLNISFLGYHDFKTRFLLVSINNGLAACDFIQTKKVYCISNDNKVYCLDEFYSQSTDYAYKKFEFIFPDDKKGLKDRFMVIDGIYNRDESEPNKIDTVFYDFINNSFLKAKK